MCESGHGATLGITRHGTFAPWYFILELEKVVLQHCVSCGTFSLKGTGNNRICYLL